MTPFRKSIHIVLHYPLTALLALPGYLLLTMIILPDFAFLSQPVIKISILLLFVLTESLLLQPALSMHIGNILDGEPGKPFFRDAIRRSKLKLLALMLLIASMLIALFIAYLFVVGIAAVTLPYDTLGIIAFILNYFVFPIPCLFAAGWYLSYLPLITWPGTTIAPALAESFKFAIRKWKKTVPALLAASFIAFAAYWAGQVLYYLANSISLLYIIDNPVAANYAGILVIIALMPLYSWLICYFHCLLRSDD